MKRILVLLAHPSIKNSTVNRALFDAVTANEQVTAVNLYEEYPDFTINVSLEQERLLNHDVVVFLFPTYWYSTPALLKEWQDKVLEYGFAYGDSGNKLHGKILLCATSTGSPKSAYQDDATNELITQNLMLPLERMAKDTGFNFVKPYVLYGARTAVQDKKLQPHVDEFINTIVELSTRFKRNNNVCC